MESPVSRIRTSFTCFLNSSLISFGGAFSVSPLLGALCMSGECAKAAGMLNTHATSTALSSRVIIDMLCTSVDSVVFLKLTKVADDLRHLFA